ncbi:MAG: hypothetical protein ABI995_13935, partial [Acidobacteriota bacterium]
ILQPFSNKASLIAIWPAILIAGHLLGATKQWTIERFAILTAVLIAAVEITAQFPGAARLFEVIGFEFYLMVALFIALVAAARRGSGLSAQQY